MAENCSIFRTTVWEGILLVVIIRHAIDALSTLGDHESLHPYMGYEIEPTN